MNLDLTHSIFILDEQTFLRNLYNKKDVQFEEYAWKIILLNIEGYEVGIALQIGLQLDPLCYFLVAVITGGPLKDNRFRLEQYHFHWGDSNHCGSEHTLNKKAFAAEVFIILKRLHIPLYINPYHSSDPRTINSG